MILVRGALLNELNEFESMSAFNRIWGRMKAIPEAIVEMLRAADTENAVLPTTILYDEGWMLRLILSALASGISCSLFSFCSSAR